MNNNRTIDCLIIMITVFVVMSFCHSCKERRINTIISVADDADSVFSSTDVKKVLNDTLLKDINGSEPLVYELQSVEGKSLKHLDFELEKEINNIYGLSIFYSEKELRRYGLMFFDRVERMKLNDIDTIYGLISLDMIDMDNPHGPANYVFVSRRDNIIYNGWACRNRFNSFKFLKWENTYIYTLLQKRKIFELPRWYWNPLTKGLGDCFAVVIYVEKRLIKKAQIFHFYDANLI